MNPRVRRPGSSACRDGLGGRAAHVAVGGLQAAEGDVERHARRRRARRAARRRARRTGVPRRSGWRSTSRRGSSPRARSAGAAGSGARCAGSGGRSRGRRRASSSSARSSSSAAHSSSKNRSFVSISVAALLHRAAAARRARGRRCRWRTAARRTSAARPTSSLIVSSSRIAADEPFGIELRDLAGVTFGERAGALARLFEQPLDARVALALDQRLQIPRGPKQLGVGEVVFGCGGHRGLGRLATNLYAYLKIGYLEKCLRKTF